jgi:hypothetical protein
MIRGGILVAAAAGALFAACANKGPPRPTCADVSISDAGVDVTAYTAITTDAQPPEAFGQEVDPGPQCTDCTQDRSLEIMTVVDFENGFAPAWFNYGESGILLEPNQAGAALTDAGLPTANPPQGPPPPYWGLQVETLAEKPGGERCGSRYALHMAGGRFSSWGGGFVTRMFVVRDEFIDRYCEEGKAENNASSVLYRDKDKNGIGAAPRYMTGESVTRDQANGCFFFVSPTALQPSLLGIDLSEYDGISFWARRGPSGQATLRVALIDDNTSADLALQVERKYWLDEQIKNPGADVDPDKAGAKCERVLKCCRHCYEDLEYQEYIAPGRLPDAPAEGFRDAKADRCWVDGEPLPHFRWKPTVDMNGVPTTVLVMWDFRDKCGPIPNEDLNDTCWVTDVKAVWDQWNRDYKRCCPRTMGEEDVDPVDLDGDPRFGGTDCMPYVFHYDQSSGSYCYHPGEVLPEKNQNRCDEGFEAAVVVDTEWKLFTIPWAELRRSTPDKPPISSHSIWQLAFFFSSGYLDTYVDDVGFYKRRPNAR